MDDAVKNFTRLGYPLYLLTMLGLWKILGVIAVLIPKFPVVKEWAYAGFTFNFLAAAISVTIVDGLSVNIIFPVIALVILAASYFYYHKLNHSLKIV